MRARYAIKLAKYVRNDDLLLLPPKVKQKIQKILQCFDWNGLTRIVGITPSYKNAAQSGSAR